MPTAAAQLYEQDFVRWAESQADALRDAARSGANLPIDWDNLIEEVESLARSERRELRNRLATVIEHLLKLEHSPAPEPRAGWRETVRRERRAIEHLLEDSPSLKAEVARMIERDSYPTANDVAETLKVYGEATPAVLAKVLGARYDADQVLGDWFPDRSDLGTPPP